MAERIARVDRARPPLSGGARADSGCGAACEIEPQATTCDVCGGTERAALFSARDYEHGVPGEWPVARCVRCNFASLSPMPRDEDVASRAGLVVPESGRVSWYRLLILCFLPFTLLQALSGRTATVAFTARRPEEIGRR